MIAATRVPIHGRSMGPRYDGSTAVIEIRFPQVGEVAVFVGDGVVRARRVVGLDAGEVILRSDMFPGLVNHVPPSALLGTIIGLERAGARTDDDKLPARRPFLALVAALAAVRRDDPEAFVGAASVFERHLASSLEEHRCAAFLGRYAAQRGIMDRLSPELQKQLRAARARSVLAADLMRRRADEVVALLQKSDIRFVLLKGAARLHEDEGSAALHESGDIDLLIAPDHLQKAEALLLNAGYVHDVPAGRVPIYLDGHHHLAPLVRPGEGFPIELHYRLADAERLSLSLDWEMLEPHTIVRQSACGEAAVLDDVASALHLAVHAVGLTRLRDIILLGDRLQALDADGRAALLSYVERERTNPIRLEAAIALAAAIAGVPWRVQPAVEVYGRWALRRNELPDRIARYAMYAEFRYAGLGRRHALWKTIAYRSKTQPKFDLTRPFRGIARVLFGLAIRAYTRRMPPVHVADTTIVG